MSGSERSRVGRCGLDFGSGHVVGCCEHSDGPLIFIENREFLV
jgi:hypothetical protein